MVVTRRLTRAAASIALLCAIACGGKRDDLTKQPAQDPSAQPSHATPPQPTAEVAEPAAAAPSWQITAKGIAPLALGAAVPEPVGGYDAAYTTTFYADAQPLEGFAFAEPPAVAFVGRGPFSKWGYDNPGEDVPAAIKQRAAALARDGSLRVDMIVITDPRPKTAQGVGVGDAYATFASKNPSATKPQQFPGLWEEPSCVVAEADLWYFFDHCDSPDRAKLIRIVVRTDEQGQDTPARPQKSGGRKLKPKGEKKERF